MNLTYLEAFLVVRQRRDDVRALLDRLPPAKTFEDVRQWKNDMKKRTDLLNDALVEWVQAPLNIAEVKR